MKSTNLFAAAFYRILDEEMMSSTAFGAAATGEHGGDVPSGSDFYATRDARVPRALGAKKRKNVPMQRRNLTNI